MKKILLAIISFASLVFGSAGIINGTNQAISFNSEPENVSVLLDGQMKCQTPCVVSIKKNSFSDITFKKDGYRSQTIPLTTAFDSVFLLNIFWDLGITDLLTGAAYEYSPNNYMVELKKKVNNYTFNNKFLDKELLSDIRSFVMIEYHTLKLEFSNDYRTNRSTQALASLLSDYYKTDNLIFIDFIQNYN
ncbi:blr5152; hypothetical protein [hydrothermal vent metagenome]|uniref:PEGA domain-containing protein n=1 Tax=hydrothermal vent metagenome TaxID=652676 RepID=A0A3B1E698_9ZZZZ